LFYTGDNKKLNNIINPGDYPMKTSKAFSIFTLILVFGIANTAFSHCQIPCGIYGDKLRFETFTEHITTIEKSMNQINELSKARDKNYNQIVRWVTNKDKHANDIIEIATNYFLAQRVKPNASHDDKDAATVYAHKIATLHEIIVYSMKAKQTTDLANVEKLNELVKMFYKFYFNEEMEKHLEGHK
jgi:nickel superoxide dismutase